MKNFLLFILTLSLFSFTTISFTEVISALKEGDATEISKYLDSSVEITLSRKSSSYSKNQASLILHHFFNEHKVKDFNLIHQSENGGSAYCIGTLVTDNGSFRTTIYMKQAGSKQLIQELRFEK